MTQPSPPPARTYDESKLLPIPAHLDDPTWARTWTRQFLRDFPELKTGGIQAGQPSVETWPAFSRSDVALNAALSLDAVSVTVENVTTLRYRPHITAARLYLGDPNLWRTRSVDSSSETRRDPNEVIAAWLNQGRAFDALFPTGTVLPPFEVVEVETVSPGDPEYFPSSIPLIVGGL